jgi:hypothetical protein
MFIAGQPPEPFRRSFLSEESKKDVASIDANNRIRRAEALMAHYVASLYG